MMQRLATIFLSIAVSALSIQCVAIAQTAEQTEASSEWDFGYELFQALLEQQGLTPVDYDSALKGNAKNSVLVVQGKLDSKVAQDIPSFCARGGTVLVACDATTYLGSICTFQEGPVATLNSAEMYQSFPDCIQISNFDAQHPLMAGVSSIVVNKSGWLKKPRFGDDQMNVIASLPTACEPTESRNQPFLATADILSTEGGQLILCADRSLFTNGMLWHADNSIFAINVANSLAAGTQRTQVCFVVQGQSLGSYQDSPLVNPNSDLPDVDLPEPKLKTMLRLMNKVVKNVEESNVVNEALANQPRNVRPPYYRRAILFVLAAIVAGLITRFLFGSLIAPLLVAGGILGFYLIDLASGSSAISAIPGSTFIASLMKTLICVPGVTYIVLKLFTSTEPTTESMPNRWMKTAFDLRSARKISDSEFGFAASMLARELCKEVTKSADPAVWLRQLKKPSAKRSTAAAESDLRIPLSTVVDLAVNSQTTHISRQRFANIGHTINELRQKHREGKLLPPTPVSTS